MNVPLTVVLKSAQLADGKDHVRFLKTHQALRMLLDSPLNKAGKLRTYVHTMENVLVELSHLIEIPADSGDFGELMSYLLRRLVVKASDGTVLARTVKNPVSKYLPPNSTKIGLSAGGTRMSRDVFEPGIHNGFTFFVDVMSGESGEEGELSICVSDFELSVETHCARIVQVFEELLDVF